MTEIVSTVGVCASSVDPLCCLDRCFVVGCDMHAPELERKQSVNFILWSSSNCEQIHSACCQLSFELLNLRSSTGTAVGDSESFVGASPSAPFSNVRLNVGHLRTYSSNSRERNRPMLLSRFHRFVHGTRGSFEFVFRSLFTGDDLLLWSRMLSSRMITLEHLSPHLWR